MFGGFFQCKKIMKKKYSLKRNEEIAKIVHKRRLIKNETFIMYYQPNNVIGHSRICISVSKKNGNAVVRNKIKRQVREMIDSIFDLNKQYDYVLIVKAAFLEKDFSFNKEKLNELYLKFISKN